MYNKGILVSIIVPVYNAERLLGRCLDSLISQTYKNIEIVCVNDASTDCSYEKLLEYQRLDPRIRIINHSHNKKAGGARNSGIDVATGEYLMFVDCDDKIPIDAISALVASSDGGSVDYVVGTWQEFYDESISFNHSIFPQIITSKEELLDYVIFKNVEFRITGCLIRRSIFNEHNIRFPEKIFYEDNPIMLIPFLYSRSFSSIQDCCYIYFADVATSQVHTISYSNIHDRVYSTKFMLDNLKKYGFYSSNKEKYDYLFLSLTCLSLSKICMLHWWRQIKLLWQVSRQIKSCLPNKFLEKLCEQDKSKIKHPVYYVLRQDIKKERKRMKQLYKKYLNKICG